MKADGLLVEAGELGVLGDDVLLQHRLLLVECTDGECVLVKLLGLLDEALHQRGVLLLQLVLQMVRPQDLILKPLLLLGGLGLEELELPLPRLDELTLLLDSLLLLVDLLEELLLD